MIALIVGLVLLSVFLFCAWMVYREARTSWTREEMDADFKEFEKKQMRKALERGSK